MIGQIQPFLQPIIVDGQEHYPQWQAPYTDHATVALSAREDLTPGDFDANEFGIRAVQLAPASD